MRITGSTRVIGIFGDPIGHTLSPAMHNAAFEALKLDMVYVPFHVSPGGLKSAIKAIKSLDMAGMNITIPHKEKVLKLVDRLDPHASAIGAVNTIVNEDGVLAGYNTDGAGYLRSLREETGADVKGKGVFILGAGGAARSILYAILEAKPASVIIANRTVERARELVNAFKGMHRGITVKASGLDAIKLKGLFPATDLLINTTSIGMMGKGEFDLPMNYLPDRTIVSDIVYRPLKTGLLKAAETRGLKTHAGLGMLVCQGAIGFELWTGKKAPVDVMRKAAQRTLKGGG